MEGIMKVFVLAAAALLFMGGGGLLAAPPDLEAGVLIYDGAAPLSVNYHSSVTIVDWNNDGKKDLVVGQFYYGNVWLFLNQGTNSAPLFDGGSLIESGGTEITTSYG